MSLVHSKGKRLRIFLQRIKAAPPADSADGALELIAKILNMVEDEYSGVDYNPNSWSDDGRMYPPAEDNRRAVPGYPSTRRYRSARHNTFVGMNGAIRIQDLDGNILLDKPGNDHQKMEIP